jgi:hypothetical protein
VFGDVVERLPDAAQEPRDAFDPWSVQGLRNRNPLRYRRPMPNSFPLKYAALEVDYYRPASDNREAVTDGVRAGWVGASESAPAFQQ